MIRQVLNLSTHTLRMTCLFIVVAMSLSFTLQAQTGLIKGVVSSEIDKDPLIGVKVSVKGTDDATVTNELGEYTIAAAENATLIFSYIGHHEIEIPIASRSIVDVTMKERTRDLEELVIVGYGTAKKTTLTGSVSTLKPSEITNVPSSDLTQSLTGRIAGITGRMWSGRPGDDSNFIKIRGGDNALVVVDGIVGRSLSSIDPNDIESFSVLKDASATAVYGARGQNGVILVTTKRGSASKPKLTYNGYVGLQTPTKTPNFLSPKQKYVKITDYYRDTYGAEMFDQAHYNYMESDPDGSIANNGMVSGATNYYTELMNKYVPQQNHSLSISGGDDRTNYYISAGILQQEGILKSNITGYDRYNARSNIDTHLLSDKSLKFSFDLNANYGDSKHSWGEEEVDGYWTVIYGKGISEKIPLQWADGRYVDMGGRDNPLAMGSKEHGTLVKKDQNVLAKAQVEYALPWVKGLVVKGLFSYDYHSMHKKDYYIGIPLYGSVNQEVPRIPKGETQPFNKETASFDYARNFEAHLNYNRTFGDHQVGGLVVFSQNDGSGNWLNGKRIKFPSFYLQQMGSGSVDGQETNGNKSEYARRGIVGRATYSYKSKYLFETNFRADASENFTPEQRWGIFPSLSLGWRVSEEPFFKPLVEKGLFSNLKIRGSIGQSGSDYLSSKYPFLSNYSFGNYVTFGQNEKNVTVTQEKGIASNPTWQTTTSYNGGLDLGMFNQKLTLEIDAFYSRTTGILMQSDKSFTLMGASSPWENIGINRRGGIEFSLNYVTKTGDFNWGVGGNFTYWNTLIENINESEGTLFVPQWRRTQTNGIGHNLWQNGGFYQNNDEIMNEARIMDSPIILPGDLRYKDINGDGRIDEYDKTKRGYGQDPQLAAGLHFNAEWKGLYINGLFTLSAMQDIRVWGNSRANGYYDDTELIFVLDEFSDVWTPKNTSAKYPRLHYERNKSYSYMTDSDFWLVNGTNVRFKNFEIGYDFKKKLIKSNNINNLRVFMSGSNLITYDFVDVFDPETAENGGGTYPLMRVLTLGVNITF